MTRRAAVLSVERRKNRRWHTIRMTETAAFTASDTDLDPAVIFGDATARAQPMTASFSLVRTGLSPTGTIFEFGSATRGGIFVIGNTDDMGVQIGSVAANQNVAPVIADVFPTRTLTFDADDFATEPQALGAVAHNLPNGDGPWYVESSTTLPAGLVAGTAYWVVHPATPADPGTPLDPEADNFSLALTPGGTAVTVTDAGTGTHTAIRAAESHIVAAWNPPTGQLRVWKGATVISTVAAVLGDFDGAWTGGGAGTHGAIGDNDADDGAHMPAYTAFSGPLTGCHLSSPVRFFQNQLPRGFY